MSYQHSWLSERLREKKEKQSGLFQISADFMYQIEDIDSSTSRRRCWRWSFIHTYRYRTCFGLHVQNGFWVFLLFFSIFHFRMSENGFMSENGNGKWKKINEKLRIHSGHVTLSSFLTFCPAQVCEGPVFPTAIALCNGTSVDTLTVYTSRCTKHNSGSRLRRALARNRLLLLNISYFHML